MLSVFLNTLWGYRTGLILTTLGLFGISLLIVYTFEGFGGKEAAEQIEHLFPDSLKALFKAQGGFASDATGFLALDYRHPFYFVVTLGFVIALSSGALAKEIERGTILVLLTSPIAKWELLLAKFFVLVTSLIIILTGSWVGTWLGSSMVGISDEVHMVTFFRIQLNMLALCLAVGGYSLFISARSSDGGQVTAWATGITVVMYFLDYLAMLWGTISVLGPFSIFYYFDPLEVAKNGGIPWTNVLILLGAGIFGLIAALIAFQRRDIAR
jgi:ABC-type transport system involved in multi-copper enzyme maturation permease subunit